MDHMTKADAHLLSIPKPKRQKKEISSSTTLAFTSHLSNLINTTSVPTETRGRSRPSANKPSLFTTHNKNTHKRALADISDDTPSPSSNAASKNPPESFDPSAHHRSQLKLEQKARLYSAMKRGDYIPPHATTTNTEPLIDFDRKWAENGGTLSSDSDSEPDALPEPEVEYEDEYGRLRRGPKSEAERMERKKQNRILGASELASMSARPAEPENLIRGPTIQVAAFNPDAETAAEMEELAAKRDRSPTPPEAVHYEANKEVRSRGTGFYSFSKDEDARKAQMEGLEAERKETERVRAERERRVRERREEVERRRGEVRERRAKKEADRFLDGLGDLTGGREEG